MAFFLDLLHDYKVYKNVFRNTTVYQSPDYSDICFDYLFDIGKAMSHSTRIRYSMILFVFTGELTIEYDGKKISVRKGEYVFLKHNTIITTCEKEPFYGAYLGFNKSFLSIFSKSLYKRKTQSDLGILENKIVKLDRTPYTQSLYVSLIPYFECRVKPPDNILRLKQLEAIYCLLMTDDRFYSCLFD